MSAEPFGAADSVYGGRAYRTAAVAACKIGADVGIISAGLGYVRREAEIPGYDLTVRPTGPGSVRQRIKGPFDHARWWAEVQKGHFSGQLSVDIMNRPLVLAALSADYARMVAEDLVAFSKAAPEALRIFGLSVGKALPAALERFILPYDIRFAGLRQDFAQRALRHFVDHILPNSDSLREQRSLVQSAMENADSPAPKPSRRRGDDETLKACIAAVITGGKTRSAVLQQLRADGWSCEQRRFTRLYESVVAAR